MEVESGKFYFIKDEFFDLFKGYKLMENKEKVVSRETLMTKLWESDNYVEMFNNEGLFFRTNINKNYLYEYIISR